MTVGEVLAPAGTLPRSAHLARQTSLHPRTRPSFCMSLRTSAHTGVAIRVSAEILDKLAAARANSYQLRICLRYYSLPCAAARRTDCHVAALLAMTCRNMQLSAWQGHFPSSKFVALFRIPQASPPLQPRTPTRLQHVIANQCAHWCGNPRPRREAWQVGCCLGKFVTPYVCARSTTFCHVLPQGVRIATSLRSSQ